MLHILYSRKEWERIRQKVFERDNHTCRLCHDPLGDSRAVHHKHYPDETLDDLVSTHISCHSKAHYEERLGIKS